MRITASSVLLFVLVLARVADAQTCGFGYVTDGGLLASDFRLRRPIEGFSDNPALAAKLREALPDVRDVLFARDGYAALVGWETFSEGFSTYSQRQAVSYLLDAFDETGRRRMPAGGHFSSWVEFNPVSVFQAAEYEDGGEPYRDVTMAVVATDHCLFSLKFSGVRKPGDDGAWNRIAAELERVRTEIGARGGPVPFSWSGLRFSARAMVDMALFILSAAAAGALAGFALTRIYDVVPGRAARRYSLFVMVACLVTPMLFGLRTALTGMDFESYEGMVLDAAIFAVHANAYFRRSPMAVLAALSFAVGLFLANAAWMAMGWNAVPRTNVAIAYAVGAVIVVCSLNLSLSPKGRSASMS